MKLIRLLIVAIVLAGAGMGAHAEKIFRFGPRIGTEVNSMRFKSDVFDSENRAGFTGGLMFEANVPVIGLSFDLSVMYVHRVNANTIKAGQTGNPNEDAMLQVDSYRKRDYIELPLNFKYRFGLPVVGKIVSPYVFTGPSFAFLTSRRAITEAYRNRSFDVSWNFGVGVQLFSHLQVGASYGLGITKAVERLNIAGIQGGENLGRNNYWTITAAWLF